MNTKKISIKEEVENANKSIEACIKIIMKGMVEVTEFHYHFSHLLVKKEEGVSTRNYLFCVVNDEYVKEAEELYKEHLKSQEERNIENE